MIIVVGGVFGDRGEMGERMLILLLANGIYRLGKGESSSEETKEHRTSRTRR